MWIKFCTLHTHCYITVCTHRGLYSRPTGFRCVRSLPHFQLQHLWHYYIHQFVCITIIRMKLGSLSFSVWCPHGIINRQTSQTLLEKRWSCVGRDSSMEKQICCKRMKEHLIFIVTILTITIKREKAFISQMRITVILDYSGNIRQW